MPKDVAAGDIFDEPFPRANQPVPPEHQLLCGASGSGTNRTLLFTNGDADYLLTYDLTPPHL